VLHAIAATGLPCGIVLNSLPPSAVQDINPSFSLAVANTTSCPPSHQRYEELDDLIPELRRSTRRLRRLRIRKGADAGT
jgi:hypothetical protein